jgi:hypothetical protein
MQPPSSRYAPQRYSSREASANAMLSNPTPAAADPWARAFSSWAGRAFERHFDARHESLPAHANLHVGLIPGGRLGHPDPSKRSEVVPSPLRTSSRKSSTTALSLVRRVRAVQIDQRSRRFTSKMSMCASRPPACRVPSGTDRLRGVDLRLLARPNANQAGSVNARQTRAPGRPPRPDGHSRECRSGSFADNSLRI